MNVAVIGGTGGLGSLVVSDLRLAGDRVRVVSRRGAPEEETDQAVEYRCGDVRSGDGLAEALDGVDVVVDVTNAQKAARAVLVQGTGRLLDAEARAGVAHHVAISIVGCDRTPGAYNQTKVAQEQIVMQGPVAWSLLRSTQFHSYVAGLLAAAARWRLMPTGRARLQPIAAEIVAGRLADAVHGEPAGRLPDIAGPEVLTLSELARLWQAHIGRLLVPLRIPMVGSMGHSLRDGAACSPAAAAAGPTFAEWIGWLGREDR
jgi:uncharacterized protein YbjT (DUF2867 family)